MKKSGVSDSYAFLLPYLLNKRYEEIMLGAVRVYDEVKKAGRDLEKAQDESKKDIYLGYSAAMFGLKAAQPSRAEVFSFEKFKTRYDYSLFEKVVIARLEM